MIDKEKFAKDSSKRRDRITSRRRFLKGAAAAGAVAALYTVPKFVTVHARQAYAAITGANDSPATTATATILTFEDSAGVELSPSTGAGAHWQESGYDAQGIGHHHREFDGVSKWLYVHGNFPDSDRIEITPVGGGTFSISSLDVRLVRGTGSISSSKGGSTGLSSGTNVLAGSNWTDVSMVTIVTDNVPGTQVWIDNVTVS